MFWKVPPVIKIYEALGAIADERVEQVAQNEARVYSSSRNKYYTVTYNEIENAIMSNDNGSYWQGYLGYPAIAYLMLKNVLPLERVYSGALRGIAWKKMNTQFTNDFEKTQQYVDAILVEKGIVLLELSAYCETVLGQIERLHLKYLGKRVAPPQGY